MFYRRKVYDKLLAWKNQSAGDKALLIEGARRIGKSTVVQEFAKNQFKSFMLIDFNDVTDVVINAFENYFNDLDTFFLILSTEYNVKLYPHESLIIFDEVQQYPKARQSIKKLVADGRYSYIETGSLVSIKENVQNITIPSEERSIKMYPMDFEEFCWALGEDGIVDYIHKCFDDKVPLEENLHKKAMLLFRQFMLVGGMPKCVDIFVQKRDFELVDAEKRDILALYKNDISKAAKSYRNKVLSIFEQIPTFLSHHEKRVRLSNITTSSSFPLYEDTFFWLADSMISNECYNCADPNVGLSMNEERTLIKCYMGDTGLLVSHAFNENEITSDELYKEILFGKLSINNGMLFENAIAQCLVASGHKLFFYTHYDVESKRNDIEIDFLLSNMSKTKFKIYPIEVKSSKQYRSISLTKFEEKYKSRIGQSYLIHPKNLSVKDDIIYIPSYMACCL